jgi:hypothetical protein
MLMNMLLNCVLISVSLRRQERNLREVQQNEFEEAVQADIERVCPRLLIIHASFFFPFISPFTLADVCYNTRMQEQREAEEARRAREQQEAIQRQVSHPDFLLLD